MSLLLYPHEALLQRPSSPPVFRVATKPARSGPRRGRLSAASFRLTAASRQEDFYELVRCLHYLLVELVPMRVSWPAEPTIYESRHKPPTSLTYFCDVIVKPVLGMLYQLRNRSTSSRISFTTIKYDDAECDLVMFTMPTVDYMIEDYDPPPCMLSCLPVIALMSPYRLQGIINSNKFAIAVLSELLRYVWQNQPGCPVLCSDLEHLIVFYPNSNWPVKREARFQSIKISRLATLRIVLSAYMIQPLTQIDYLLYGSKLWDHRALGPLLYRPETRMRPDHFVFSSFHRHSDFDFPTLYRSPPHREQFFRWKENAFATINPQCVVAGDVLNASTNNFTRKNGLLRPCFPALQPPAAARQHVEQCRRAHPLGSFSKSFMFSSSFSLSILSELTGDPDPRVCRVYVCKLLAVNGRSVPGNLPALCVKLFDDRFFPISEDRHLRDWRTSEEFISRELAVYNKLTLTQGSLIPYCLGAHTFQLPGGIYLDGILMEYVQAPCAEKEIVQSLAENEQVQLIQSVRHAVRVLQFADISQHDWHSGQILVNRVGRARVHCVLIDFGNCSQAMFPGHEHRWDDFGESMETLCYEAELPEEMVAKVFGRREVWDMFSTMRVELERQYNKPPMPLLEMAGLLQTQRPSD